MALISCHECKHQISSEADKCPSCGVKIKKPMGFLSKAALAVIGFVAFINIVISLLSQPHQPPQFTAQAPKISEEDRLKKEHEDRRFYATIGALRQVREAMRDPASAEWIVTAANDDASVICIGYRGKNGFGGYTKEHVVFYLGIPSQKVSDWKKYCVEGDLIDMTRAAEVEPKAKLKK